MPTACLKSGLLATLVGILLLIGCKPAQKNTVPENSVDQTVTNKIGKDFESYPSPSGSYLLFVEKVNPAAANQDFVFISNPFWGGFC